MINDHVDRKYSQPPRCPRQGHRHVDVGEAILDLPTQPNCQLNATIWMSPGKTHRKKQCANPHNHEKLKGCCFKPQFGAAYYIGVDTRNTWELFWNTQASLTPSLGFWCTTHLPSNLTSVRWDLITRLFLALQLSKWRQLHSHSISRLWQGHELGTQECCPL